VSSNRDIRAEQRLLEAFPDDSEIIPTSGDGLMCGVRAIQLSMTEQHADVGVPTQQGLVQYAGQFDNTNRGLAQPNPVRIQLGYVLADGRAFLVPVPPSGLPPAATPG